MTSKEDIKKWMKLTGMERFRLAELCCVDKRTVDSWFYKRGKIPSAKLALIEKMMEEQTQQTCAPRLHDVVEGYMDDRIVLSVSQEEYRQIEQQAAEEGMTVKAYCHYIIKWAAENHDEAISGIRKMIEAESLPPSGSRIA